MHKITKDNLDELAEKLPELESGLSKDGVMDTASALCGLGFALENLPLPALASSLHAGSRAISTLAHVHNLSRSSGERALVARLGALTNSRGTPEQILTAAVLKLGQ